jgi:hypothetical protein
MAEQTDALPCSHALSKRKLHLSVGLDARGNGHLAGDGRRL